MAEITGLIDGGLEAHTTVPIEIAHARSLELTASPTDLRSADTSTLAVTVRDPWTRRSRASQCGSAQPMTTAKRARSTAPRR
ncbi:MAG: hypothetical protein R3A10_03550 [Caldilineaceae bacterium]